MSKVSMYCQKFQNIAKSGNKLPKVTKKLPKYAQRCQKMPKDVKR